MLTALLLGILIGFTLSIPPGPLALAFMKKAVCKQYKDAMMVGIGAAVMDVVYNLLAAFASSAIVVSLSSLFLENRWLSLLFQLLSIVVLIVLGVRYLRDKHSPESERHMVERERMQEERARQFGHGSPFLLGTLIAVTNLATPTFLPSMIAVISYLHAEGILIRSITTNVFYSLGFGIGTTLWFLAIVRFIMRHHDRLTPNFITTMYKFAGGAFVVFAILLAYNVFMTMSWSVF